MQFTAYLVTAAASLIVPAMADCDDSLAIPITLYHDGDCQQPFKDICVLSSTCATPSPGWSSMKITKPRCPATVTAYSDNNCGNPAGGSHGYSGEDTGCLKDFGFVANAVGFGACVA